MDKYETCFKKVVFTPDMGKLTDELLRGLIFDTLIEATVLTERWCREY